MRSEIRTSAQLVLSGRLRDPVEGDRERAGMLWSMMQTSFRRALDICPTIGGAYKVMVPPYEGIDNNSIDQEMQFRDSLAMDPNDAGLLRQYAIHLMQHGMNEEAVEAMRRAYDIEPLLPMIPFQLAHTLNRLGRCDEALALAAEAEELGGQPKVAIEAPCAWRHRDRDALNAAGHRFIEVGMGFPFQAMEMSVEEFNEARLDDNSPLRPVMLTYASDASSSPTCPRDFCVIRKFLLPLMITGLLAQTACGERPADRSADHAVPVTQIAAPENGIRWFEGTVDAAFSAGKQQQKPVVLYWGEAGGHYCNPL